MYYKNSVKRLYHYVFRAKERINDKVSHLSKFVNKNFMNFITHMCYPLTHDC